MGKIENIGSDNNQKIPIIRDTGDEFNLILEFYQTVNAWFMTINTPEKTINKLRIVVGGNILHQFRNVLKFGIKCECLSEPMFLDDFSSGRASLYLLTKDECDAYAEVVSGQTTA